MRIHVLRSATFVAAIAIAASLSSCSTDEEPDASAVTSTTEADGSESSTDEPTTDTTISTEAGEADASPIVVFDVIETDPSEPGPHPELAWAEVAGAATYDLIVLDAAGETYWAWSGTESSVHLGGVESPDAVGAWVFEPLTWIVTARDAEGEPLAMSAKADLTP